ncbi:MAG: sigma-70 family RNA polymerase sigma factor [Chitinophagales bacterium]
MSNDELQKIIQALQDGDNSPLKQFFEAHAMYCVKQVRSKTNCDTTDAKDVFMEALLILRDNLLKGKITELTNVKGYLASTSVNQWRKNYHNRKREKENQSDLQVYFYEERNANKETFDHLIDQEMKEELQEKKQQRLKQILTALKSIDQKCQKIIKLFYVQHLSMTKIAELVGLSNANVAKTAKRRCYLKWLNAIDQQQTS